jgi:hypothetical protein
MRPSHHIITGDVNSRHPYVRVDPLGSGACLPIAHCPAGAKPSQRARGRRYDGAPMLLPPHAITPPRDRTFWPFVVGLEDCLGRA